MMSLFVFAIAAIVPFTAKAAPFITGTVYDYNYPGDWTTNIGSGTDVRLLVNGVDSTLTSTTDGSGVYSIDLAASGIYNAGDVLTLYIDNETPNGVTVTIGAVTDAGIASLDVYERALTVRSEDATNITNVHLDTANNSDTDITTVYDDAGVTTLEVNQSLYLWPGTSFAPGGDVLIRSEGYMAGTYVTGAETFSVSSDGPFDPGVGNTYGSFANLSGEPMDLVNNTLTAATFLNDGDMDLNDNDLIVSTSYTNTGKMNATGGQTITAPVASDGGNWEFYGDGGATSETYDISNFFTTYGNLTINDGTSPFANADVFRLANNTAVNGEFYLDEGTFNSNGFDFDVNGDFIIDDDPDPLFIADSSNINVSGEWDLTVGSTFQYDTSTVTFDGVNQDIGYSDTTFCNLVLVDPADDSTAAIKSFDAGNTYTIASGCTLTAQGIDADDHVVVDSNNPGNQFSFNVIDGAPAVTANDMDVRDSELQYAGVSASPAFNPADSTNLGNTLGWFTSVPYLTRQLHYGTGFYSPSSSGGSIDQGQVLDISGITSSVNDGVFGNDGSKYFVSEFTNKSVHQWTLATPYDLTTAAHNGAYNVFTNGGESNPLDVAFSAAGDKMFVVGNTADGGLYYVKQYTLTTPWDITGVSVSYDGDGERLDVNTSGGFTAPSVLAFNNSGSRLYVAGQQEDKLKVYDLSPNYDISSGVLAVGEEISIANPDDAGFNQDGTKLMLSNTFHENDYTLSAPYDLSSGTLISSGGILGTNMEAINFINYGSAFTVLTSDEDVHLYSVDLEEMDYAEVAVNDGAVDGSNVITLFGDTFADLGGGVLTAATTSGAGAQVVVSGAPAGLTPFLALSAGNTIATLTFTSNATAHEDVDDDTSGITLAFEDTAFTGGDAASVLNSGETTAYALDVDFDFNDGIPMGSIGGFAWEDSISRNGILDAGEVAGELENQEIELYLDDGDGIFEPNGDDSNVDGDSPDTAGAFDFTGLSAGQYWIHVDGDEDFINYVATGSTVNPVLVTIIADQDYNGVNFSYASAALVGNYIFNDADNDGTFDNGFVGGGTVLGLQDDDEFYEIDFQSAPFNTFNGGLGFDYYGTNYRYLDLNTNGTACFHNSSPTENVDDCAEYDRDDYGTAANPLLQSDLGPMISLMWFDLTTDDETYHDVYHTVSATKTIFRWSATDLNTEDHDLNFELHLNSDGTIELAYGDQINQPFIDDGEDNLPTIGLSAGDGTRALLSSYHNPANAANYFDQLPSQTYTYDGTNYVESLTTGVETGFANVTIEIYLDDGDGVFEPGVDDGVSVASLTTDTNGKWEAQLFDAGDYWIDVTDTGNVLTGLGVTGGFASAEPVLLTGLAVDDRNYGVDLGYGVPTNTDLIVEFNSTAWGGGAEASVVDSTIVIAVSGGDTTGQGVRTFDVVLSDPGGFGSMTSGLDYTAGPISVTIPEGDYTSGGTVDVIIPILDDAIVENQEYLNVGFANFGANIGLGDVTGDFTTTDSVQTSAANDDNVTVEFDSATYASVDEATDITLVMQVSGAQLESSEIFGVTVTGGSATGGGTDFTFTEDGFFGAAPVSIPVGDYSTTGTVNVTITLHDDSLIEGDETILLQVVQSPFPSAVVIGSQSTTTATIIDDDALTATLNQAAGQADATNVDSASFSIVFSQPINPATFDAADITLTGTTGTVTTGPTTTDNITWNFTVTGMTDGDTVTATLLAAAVQNLLADDNEASTSGDNSVTYDAAAPTDSDGDSNPDSIEDAGFNGGDGNGDGVLDSLQTNVAGAPNPVTGAYTTLETSGTCAPIAANEFVSESTLAVQDEDADYPVGLIDFRLACATAGQSATVIQYYDQEYDTSDWVYKKYNSLGTAYADISSLVTYGTHTHTTGPDTGTTVTTVTFTVTDGDPQTDEDGIANTLINDPSGPSIAIAAVETIPVHRFWSETYESHFYTRSETEKDSVIADYDDSIWRYEGVAFYAFSEAGTNRSVVHRFWSPTNRSHFYTISEAEKAVVESNSEWEYEGEEWYAYANSQSSSKTMYRFWSENYRSHFYTTSEAERDSVIANDTNWAYEGAVYHVPTS